MRIDSHAISHFKELCPWIVQKGTILTNPGPLGENTVAHMTQQNTRLCLASIRGTKGIKWGQTWCTCGGPWKLCGRRTNPHHRGQAFSCKQQFNGFEHWIKKTGDRERVWEQTCCWSSQGRPTLAPSSCQTWCYKVKIGQKWCTECSMIKARLEKNRHCKRIHLLFEGVCKGHSEFLLADILNGDRRHLLWKNITVIMRARVASVKCWCKRGELILNIFKLSFGSSSFVSPFQDLALLPAFLSSPSASSAELPPAAACQWVVQHLQTLFFAYLYINIYKPHPPPPKSLV